MNQKKIHRQDYVDNRIYLTCLSLVPEEFQNAGSLDWDIEFIGAIRDEIQAYLTQKLGIPARKFYPELEESHG